MDIEKVAKAVRENTGEELPELEEALRQLEELRNRREYEKRRDEVVGVMERDAEENTLMAANPSHMKALYDAGYRKVTPLTDEDKEYLVGCYFRQRWQISGLVDAVEMAIMTGRGLRK